jgi:hypothetical protein
MTAEPQGSALRPILRCTRAPNNGVSGVCTSSACGASGERIGESSQQTLSDANLLKLQMTHGVKLVAPFVKTLMAMKRQPRPRR